MLAINTYIIALEGKICLGSLVPLIRGKGLSKGRRLTGTQVPVDGTRGARAATRGQSTDRVGAAIS
jgi:hypothetical protein